MFVMRCDFTRVCECGPTTKECVADHAFACRIPLHTVYHMGYMHIRPTRAAYVFHVNGTITLTITTLRYLCLNHGDQRFFFKFEIIRNVLVISFRFIWISMVWVYVHYIYINSFSAEIVFRRQSLTYVDVRFWRLKTVPALRELIFNYITFKHFFLIEKFPANMSDWPGVAWKPPRVNILCFLGSWSR